MIPLTTLSFLGHYVETQILIYIRIRQIIVHMDGYFGRIVQKSKLKSKRIVEKAYYHVKQ